MDIVLIKKIFRSLYASIIARISISAIISLAILCVLLYCTNYFSMRQNTEFWHTNFTQIEELVEQIEMIVDNRQMTFKQAKDYKFLKLEQNSKYEIEFFSTYNDFFDEIRYFYELEMFNNGYFYEIDFIDGTGFISIQSDKIDSITNILIIVSIGLCIMLFLVIAIYLIFKELSYIKVIEQGINNMSDNDILYKIPIKGQNELTRLANSINNMGDMLYAKIEQERETEMNQRLLITNMSHDIKTPLTSMTGYMNVIKKKLSSDHEVYPLIEVAHKNGKRLEKLVEDLFLYSKLISKDVNVNKQTININVILHQILEVRTDNIVFKEIDVDLYANIDIEKFYRVVDNLIGNAEKYGVPDEVITITSRLQEETILIDVKNLTNDNLEHKLHKLSNRLYTANEDRTNGSSGLGLSIVVELLKMMNGELTLSYEDNIFTATISLNRKEVC